VRGAGEVAPGVFLVARTLGSNVYITTGTSPAVIDAGFHVDAARVIRCFSGGGTPPVRVVATHYHLDHSGALARIKERFGAFAAAHALDAPVIEGRAPYGRLWVDPLRTAYYRALSPLLLRFEPTAVEERLEEGDTVDALGGLEVVVVGGHTAGSVALYQQRLGVLFSGDILRNERGVLEGPPPRFSPNAEEAFYNTREKLLELDFGVLLPGHGEPVTRDARGAVRRMMMEEGRAV